MSPGTDEDLVRDHHALRQSSWQLGVKSGGHGRSAPRCAGDQHPVPDARGRLRNGCMRRGRRPSPTVRGTERPQSGTRPLSGVTSYAASTGQLAGQTAIRKLAVRSSRLMGKAAWLAPVVGAALLAGCGSTPERAVTVGAQSAEPGTTSTPSTSSASVISKAKGARDQLSAAQAKAALLTVKDMPTGWAQAKNSNDGDSK